MPRPFLTQIGQPTIEEAFNGLRAITRIFDVNGEALRKAKLKDEVFLAYGTADEEFKTALLVRRTMQQVTGEASGYKTRLIEVYEEFLPGKKVSTQEDRIIRLPDGRTQMIRKYVCLSKDAETVAATIGTVVDGRACNNVEIIKAGVGCQVVETYISAGKLAESDAIRNNGQLLLKTLVYFNQVPQTPGGYVLIDTQKRDTEGTPTYTYQFAKGDGEIGRDEDHKDCGTTVDGTIGITILNIVHLTSDVGVEPTWASVAGYVKISVRKSEESGHRIWRAVFAKGVGLVSEKIHTRQDGLREVTWVSLGERQAPAGDVTLDTYDLRDGYTVFTVSTMQTAAGGGTVNGHSISFERYVPFTYPGRAKRFSQTVNGRTFLDVFRSPPVTTDLLAIIEVSYQTSNQIGSLPHSYWNPKEWAVVRAQWVGLRDTPNNVVEALPGYRSVDETPLEETATTITDGSSLSCMGQVVFGGKKGWVICTGGPADPGGTEWVLDVTIEPAYYKSDGTPIYRRTLVKCTVPAQAALPV